MMARNQPAGLGPSVRALLGGGMASPTCRTTMRPKSHGSLPRVRLYVPWHALPPFLLGRDRRMRSDFVRERTGQAVWAFWFAAAVLLAGGAWVSLTSSTLDRGVNRSFAAMDGPVEFGT